MSETIPTAAAVAPPLEGDDFPRVFIGIIPSKANKVDGIKEGVEAFCECTVLLEATLP